MNATEKVKGFSETWQKLLNGVAKLQSKGISRLNTILQCITRAGRACPKEAELNRLWKKLVKLYHPDRFAHEPEKLETYHKLTAAINRAKDSGDIQTLREIAEDPHGFILRQGWAGLDFSDAVEIGQLRRLYETLQLEIISVFESLNQLRESPDYELCQLSVQKAGVLDELASERARLLDQESAELEQQAERLAAEIKELNGEEADRIG